MVNIFSLLLLVTFIVTVGLILREQKRLFRTFATMLSIIALTFLSNLPVIAATNLTAPALDNSTQVQDQNTCRFEESLSSIGDELEGLCVAQGQNGSQNDADIIKEIKSKALDENNLIVRVGNGMVLLSGTMKNEETARRLIKEVEQIPGVKYITVELGFTDKFNIELG